MAKAEPIIVNNPKKQLVPPFNKKEVEIIARSEIESLRNKYANVILERKNAREQINALEEE